MRLKVVLCCLERQRPSWALALLNGVIGWCMFAGRLRAPGASKGLSSVMIYRAFPGGPAGIGLSKCSVVPPLGSELTAVVDVWSSCWYCYLLFLSLPSLCIFWEIVHPKRL